MPVNIATHQQWSFEGKSLPSLNDALSGVKRRKKGRTQRQMSIKIGDSRSLFSNIIELCT